MYSDTSITTVEVKCSNHFPNRNFLKHFCENQEERNQSIVVKVEKGRYVYILLFFLDYGTQPVS